MPNWASALIQVASKKGERKMKKQLVKVVGVCSLVVLLLAGAAAVMNDMWPTNVLDRISTALNPNIQINDSTQPPNRIILLVYAGWFAYAFAQSYRMIPWIKVLSHYRDAFDVRFVWSAMPMTAVCWAAAPIIEFSFHIPVAEALIFLPLLVVSAYLLRMTSRNGRTHIVEIRHETERLMGELVVVVMLAVASVILPGIENEFTRMALLLTVLARHVGESVWHVIHRSVAGDLNGVGKSSDPNEVSQG